MKTLLQYYWLALIVTLVLWALIGWKLGLAALITTILLTLLEITFSADNAVVNSRVLAHMSRFWQQLFITVGIIFAVFIVRFLLPIILVMISADLSLSQTINLSLNDPENYGEALHKAEPFINSFGGIFLLLVALDFFIDKNKQHHWFRRTEALLSHLDRLPKAALTVAVITLGAITIATEAEHELTVLVSGVTAILLYSLLQFIINFMEERQIRRKIIGVYTGGTAFVAFMYLQVLDASFSLDGVIGAFAITSNAAIIMAGLGAGAIWVREMTIHLVKTKTLGKFIYLESGAHWAIAFLAGIMLLKIIHIELPEVIVGLLGVVCIGLSIYSSRQKEVLV